MQNSVSAKNNDDSELNISEILQPYISRWYLFFLSVFFFLAFGVFYILITTPVYKIQSTVLIKDAKKTPGADVGVLSDIVGLGGMQSGSVDNELEIFKSKKLIQKVVKESNLQIKISAKKGFKKIELFENESPIIVNVIQEKDYEDPIDPIQFLIKGDKITLFSDLLPNEKAVFQFNKTIHLPFANIIIQKNPNYSVPQNNTIKEFYIEYSSFQAAVNKYRKAIKVDLVSKDATVLEISIKDENKKKAETIINKLVQAYNYEAINDKNAESKKTKDFIDDRISIIANELGQVENQKENYKVANNITDIAAEAPMYLQATEQNKARLLETETQLAITEDLISYTNKLGSYQTLPASIGINNAAASENISAYNQLILQRNQLLESATPQNPLVIDLNKQISTLRTSVIDALQKYKLSLLATRNQVYGQRQESTAKVNRVPALEKMFRSIERQQQIKENLYLLLLQKREEAAISLAITTPKARVIDLAYPEEKPDSPKKMIVLAISFFLGLLFPMAYIYLKVLFNDKIISIKDIQKQTKIPVLGEIPKYTNKKYEIIQTNNVSPIAEAFRILITNLKYLLPKKELGKTVFITSTVKGEGKTFISINIAAILANPKHKTIIIGSDIRNPQLQRYVEHSRNNLGLTEFLYDNQIGIEKIIHKYPEIPHLDVIYSGAIPPNPAELLQNGRFETLISELSKTYNYIVVDTAPLMLVTDTLLNAHLADATLYVTRSLYTERKLIDFANNLVGENKIKNVGFVLNDLKKENFGYGKKHGYGYYFVEETKLKKILRKFFFKG